VTFSFANEEITILECYVLTSGRSVTAFLAPPRSQRPGQGPRLPHLKASPVIKVRVFSRSLVGIVDSNPAGGINVSHM
jgi:hypothetical protein